MEILESVLHWKYKQMPRSLFKRIKAAHYRQFVHIYAHILDNHPAYVIIEWYKKKKREREKIYGMLTCFKKKWENGKIYARKTLYIQLQVKSGWLMGCYPWKVIMDLKLRDIGWQKLKSD